MCSACRAWASQRPEKLRAPCHETPTLAGAVALSRLRKGLHPDSSRGAATCVEKIVPLWLPYGPLDRMLVEYIRIPDVVPHNLEELSVATPAAREAVNARRKRWADALIAAATADSLPDGL